MVKKRPFGDEELYEGSSKHPRQLDYTNQLVSFLQFVHAEDTPQQSKISGEALFCFKEEKHAGGITSELPKSTEKYSKIEGKNEAEASPSPLLLTSEHYNSDWHVRAVVHCEKTHISLLAYPPKKLVPIGPDFQADIPEWGAQGAQAANNVENKFGGICVIPMPEFISFSNTDYDAENGRTGCNCEDSGSVRCVRQHIQEARENLWRSVGQERFSELGFSDMGEVVSEKWSQEEELLFRDAVFSNPVSSGHNFWDHLSMVFPYRTRRDIVSYYFNVFVLQKRSVQNRYDPMSIDSDDDEWLGIVDSKDDDVWSDEGDGDSVSQSKDVDFSDCKNLKFCNNVIKRHFCDEYVLEHCETKVWDVACPCPTWRKNEVEFLPTCSVIEEVFGLGSLNYMPGDGKGLS